MEDKTTLTESTVVVMADHLTSAQVEGDRVLLDLEDGIYYGLNETGAHVWEHIQEPTPVGTIVTTIVEAYDIDYERGFKDVVSLLQDLEENGLVEVEDEES